MAMGLAAARMRLTPSLFARLHGKAATTLGVQDSASLRGARAAEFFADACAASATPGAAGLRATLLRRNAGLLAANVRLRQENERRRELAIALKQRSRQDRALLDESRRGEQNSRRLAHHLLNAQEDERTRLSLALQNDIAQSLIGLDVRLVALQREAQVPGGLENGIASVQQLVLDSQQSIRRIGRADGNP